MPAPSSQPEWASSGPITVPTSGKKAAGFAPGERGAAQYLNWLFNLIWQWILWFQFGARTHVLSITNLIALGWSADVGPGGFGDGTVAKSPSALSVSAQLEVPIGRRITDVSFQVLNFSGSSRDLTVNVYSYPSGSGAGTLIGTVTLTSVSAAAYATHALDVTDTVVDGTTVARVEMAFVPSGSNIYVRDVRYTHDAV